MMYWDIIEVRSIAPRELAVRFEDGLSGVIYIDLSFCTGVFDPLRNDQMAGSAQVSNGVVVWPNGLDLAPDTMYREIKRSPDRRYNLFR
ncbi:DUF2442 domain-containing protein [Candidatus Methylospira mobilis]|uniref:DUF2442 domain-containing protein n=1 Tax=Candidatus Methylospira mobilis TaxID=1808979 RepID=A0A5Q0BBU1_9GAMM|nr:DUF2442 domain-containing protein [Candidatus Methylospira mobilis]QFY41413.1 DUF2442 domain-containing protein [Candidatus Methylospira mobilis]